MAVKGYLITVSSSGAPSAIAGQIDPLAKANTALTDLTTALAVAAISGNSPATTAVTLVQTDVTALKAAINGNIAIMVDTAVVTTKNALFAALEDFKRAVQGSDAFT